MMSPKLAFPALLRLKVFQNKDYDVIIMDYDVTGKIVSRDSITLQIWACEQSLVTVASL